MSLSMTAALRSLRQDGGYMPERVTLGHTASDIFAREIGRFELSGGAAVCFAQK